MDKRRSIRVFIVQNGKILLQDMTDSNGNLLIDSIGSFVENEDTDTVLQRVVKELLNNLADKVIVTQAAAVKYIIHKSESRNNKVESDVFLGELSDNVIFEPIGNWKWYAYDKIPYDLIYTDVKLWLPGILKGKLLRVEVEVSQSDVYAQSAILRKHLETVTRF